MKKIVFTGGGTLGHIYPNIVLANSLKNNHQIYYIGEKNSMEKKMCEKNGINFYAINAVKLDRYKKLSNLKIPFVLPKCVFECKKILEKIQPDLVFSKGGYVSLPVVISAKMLKIEQICHESDCSLGIVNQIAYKLGATVFTSHNCNFNNGIKVGIPLKPELFLYKNTDKLDFFDSYNKEKGFFDNKKQTFTKPTILVTGGSQGAKFLNDFIIENAEQLPYNFVIIGGKTLDLTIKKPNLKLINFTDQMEKYYANCDIVLCRAGATTIEEILALNKKAILVPLPTTVSRGDQLQNAENVECDTIKVIEQNELSTEKLVNIIDILQKTTQTKKDFINPKDKILKIIEEKLNKVPN